MAYGTRNVVLSLFHSDGPVYCKIQRLFFKMMKLV